MSSTSDIDKLIGQFPMLEYKQVGNEYVVKNPANGKTTRIGLKAVGRSYKNYRAQLQRLLKNVPPVETPPPMVAALASVPTPEDLTRRAFDGWDIGSLLRAAQSQGVNFDFDNGFQVTWTDSAAEPLARLIQERENEVLALLNLTHPPTTESELMPKIGETTSITRIPTPADRTRPAENLADDAYLLWAAMRKRAAEQGNIEGTNAGEKGVLWHGALSALVKQESNWDNLYRMDVSRYLEQSLNAKCQKKGSSPVWWIRDVWNDGGLTVTKKPTPADIPNKPTPAAQPAPTTPTDPDAENLAVLHGFANRITTAEQRASDAEKRAQEADEVNAELHKEIEQLRTKLAAAEAKLKQNDSLRADLSAAEATLEQYRSLLAILRGAA